MRRFPGRFDLVEDLKGHVELANGTEGLRDLPHLPLETPRPVTRDEQRQRLAHASRGDARLVKRVTIAARRSGQILLEGPQPLTNEEFRGGQMVHARMGAQNAAINIRS
jgi:hypothetical protein